MQENVLIAVALLIIFILVEIAACFAKGETFIPAESYEIMVCKGAKEITDRFGEKPRDAYSNYLMVKRPTARLDLWVRFPKLSSESRVSISG
jgi:hypothetical protein